MFYRFRLLLMAIKIVIASDSFKGSLTSAEVAVAAAAGINEVLPSAEVVRLAVADGGEGTADALVSSLGGEWVNCDAGDPLGRSVKAAYGMVETAAGMTALIDMSSASGLTLLAESERDPMVTTTIGTGQMIVDAYNRGCRNFMIGIGGSATCDGGSGMLTALGFRFIGEDGRELPPGGGALLSLASIDTSDAMIDITGCRFIIISDVTNPLYGPDGAACVFAPQKGASPEKVALLDKALRRYAEVVRAATGCDVADTPGAGAAGGLGEAFLAFFNSELKSGVDAVLDLVDFDRAVKGASLVITGEGRIDSQTLFGKLPLGVCRRAAAAGVPTVAIAGMVAEPVSLLKDGFAGVFPIMRRVVPLDKALTREEAAENVEAITASIAKFYYSLTH